MNDKTRRWLRRWLPLLLFVVIGLLTLAQAWLSVHPG